ncbi:MAG: Na+/H+ antiporter NhaC family protein [Anaerovoracaceae bacterium]
MALIIGFLVFMAAMILCLILGYPIILALVVGLVAFIAAGTSKGFSYREVSCMALKGVRDSLIVLEIMFMIGFITAIWRASGTITFFVYYGVKFVTPPLFVLLAFVMACLLSYILGTSFSVSGTLGVIFMALARSGGVDPLVVAGAIMSGIYFGDRCSPASSSAILVANVTKTDLMDNVKSMHKTGILPVGICIVLYAVLSVKNPLHQVDASIMDSLLSEFSISFLTLIPAVFILVLPMFKLDIRWAFLGSILSGFVLMITLQGMDVIEALKCCILGYVPQDDNIKNIIGGGGAVSMLEVCGIIMLSCSYSGIFKGTDILSELQGKINNMMSRTGRFLMMMILGAATSIVFCSQTIAIMLCSDLMTKPYEKTGGSKEEMAIDIENSTVMLSVLVPWNIACTVPLEMMGVGIGTLMYSYLVFILPVIYIFTKKIWFRNSVDMIEI